MRFRNRVREVRERRGLSIAALALAAGVSDETIYTIERDAHYAPRGSVILRLSTALNDERLFWIEREPNECPPDEGV